MFARVLNILFIYMYEKSSTLHLENKVISGIVSTYYTPIP